MNFLDMAIIITVLSLFSSSSAREGRLRGAAEDIPGWGNVQWGGYSFDDSPAAVNPWESRKRLPMVADLNPVAPFDRTDKTWTGRAFMGHELSMPPDILPPYQYPRTFPGEKGPPNGHAGTDDTDIDKRSVIAHPDRVRSAPWGTIQPGVQSNYPVTAPGDETPQGPHPVAIQDKVPAAVARYAEQVYDRSAAPEAQKQFERQLNKVDTDKDQAISRDEYNEEVEGRQNKTKEEANRLWNKFHPPSSQAANGMDENSPDMSKMEFQRLASTGFDLDCDGRTDVSSTITFPGGVDLGHWGACAMCNSGTYAVGARLKVMPTSNDTAKDNTGLNSFELKCQDGEIKNSADGPDGSWTDWADCPAGQKIYAMREKVQGYQRGRDNSGVSSLEFMCRSPDLTRFSTLRFGSQYIPADKLVVANGTIPEEGAWTAVSACGNSGSVCGAQVRSHVGQGEGSFGSKDDIGVGDIRFYCCATQIDCTDVCGKVTKSSPTPACVACKNAASIDG